MVHPGPLGDPFPVPASLLVLHGPLLTPHLPGCTSHEYLLNSRGFFFS